MFVAIRGGTQNVCSDGGGTQNVCSDQGRYIECLY
jgi:hypothetical protein